MYVIILDRLYTVPTSSLLSHPAMLVHEDLNRRTSRKNTGPENAVLIKNARGAKIEFDVSAPLCFGRARVLKTWCESPPANQISEKRGAPGLKIYNVKFALSLTSTFEIIPFAVCAAYRTYHPVIEN